MRLRSLWTVLHNNAGVEWATGLIQRSDGGLFYGGFSKPSPAEQSFQSDLALFSNEGESLWSRSIIDSYAMAYGIALTESQGVYLAGHTLGNLGIASKPGHFDNFVQRYDGNGNLEWTLLIGTSGIEQGLAIASDLSGQLYMAGWTTGSLAGASAGNYDVLLSSINPDGTIAWHRQFGSSAGDHVMAMGVGKDNSIYITGFTGGNLNGQSNSGGDDAFLSRLNTNGDLLWTRQLGGTGVDHAYGVLVSGDNSIYITGRWETIATQDEAPDQGDVFIAKYSQDGDLLWTQILRSSGYEYGRSIAEADDGHILVTGRTDGNLEGELNAGGFDAFVSLLDRDGSKIWTSLIGTELNDAGNVILRGLNGMYFLSGMTEGGLDGQANYNHGTYDGYVKSFTLDSPSPIILPGLSIRAVSVNHFEGDPGTGTPFSFTVHRSGNLSLPSSVSWSVAPRGSRSRSPVDANDFGGTFPSGLLDFAPNETRKVITVNIQGDSAVERDEGFSVNISNPSGALLGTATANAVIRNDDTSIGLLTKGLVLDESNSGFTPFSFTVHRSGNLSLPSSVSWSVAPRGSRSRSPVDANDFGGTFPSGLLDFAPNETRKVITVNIQGDSAVERDEGFSVNLSNPSGALLSTATANAVIRNDDTSIGLFTKGLVLDEGNSGFTPFSFTVHRSGKLSLPSSIDWAVQGAGVSPADQWDFEGDQFPSGTIDFAPGESTQAITVNVRGDAELETAERFQLNLFNAVRASLNPNALSAQALIGNDDTGTWIYDWVHAQPLGDTPGVLVAKLSLDSSRPNEQDLNLTALRVDLSTPGLSLSSTKPISDWQADSRETLTQTTREFVTSSRENGEPVVAAINTAFYDLTDHSQAVPTNLLGYAVSGGTLVSPTQAYHPFFLQDPIIGARLVREPASAPDPSGINVAVAGMSNGIVLWDGLVTGPAEPADPILNARSGLGLSRDNRFLTLLTVDRSLRSFSGPTYWGAGIRDVGSLLAGFGSYTGLNLDGGGSTQMAWWDPTSQSAQLLNAPLFGLERHVGSNLGIVYQQPLSS